MAESGRRFLKTTQSQAVRKLYEAINAWEQTGNRVDTPMTMKEQDPIKDEFNLQKLQEKERELSLVQQSLDTWKENLLQAEKLRASAELLSQTATPHDEGLINVIKLNADRLTRKNSEKVRVQLEKRQQVIEAEIAMLKIK